jgi:putative DNA primase/helicase
LVQSRQAFTQSPAKEIVETGAEMMTDIDRIREALQFMPVGGHDERVRVGCMVKSELGDTGRDLWDEWRGDRGNDEAASVWKSISETGKLTIGTLFYEAKANGWRDDGMHQKPTPEEIAERRRIAAERAAKEEAEIARERADTAKNAAAILKAATEAKADHPYLVRKRVSPVATLREIGAGAAAAILGYPPKSGGDLLAGRLLVVPVKQGDGISTLELIDGDKRKAALAGRGSKVGGYWATQRLPEGDGAGLTLLIGEGVATVLSAFEASGHPAIAALSSGNLPAVAKAMRERYPAAVIVILADLVKVTGEPDLHAIEAEKVGAGRTAIPDFGSDRDPDMTDFNDMAQICGVEAVARAIENASASTRDEHQPGKREAPAGDTEGNGWPDPHPLAAKVEPEPYPLDALPDTIRAAVEEVAGFVKAPAALVASSALAALSLACQAHIDVRRDEILSGPVGLFLLTIAESGERKSQADKMFMQPIEEYQDAQAEAAKPILKDHKAALAAWEAKYGGVKEKIRQLAKDNKPTASLESDLRDLEHDKPEPPRVPKLKREDTTPEGLAKKLQKEWPSAGVVSNEAGIVFGAHGMGSESVMRNLALLNKLWDGGRYQSDRGDEERSRDVRGARLTMGLMIQETTLRAFFANSKGLARGTGFLARFMVGWPESRMGTRFYTPPVAGSPALSKFNRRITEILNQPVPIDDDGILTPAMLSLAPDAKAAWIEYHDAIESELVSGGELHDVKDVASKSADNAARLAALFQQFEHGMGGAIGLDSFERASRITAWHLSEARRFFGELALPAELADAARLDSWLIEYCQRERTHLVPTREAQRLGPIRDKEKLTTALRELEELDRVKVAQEGRRKTIKVNPTLVVTP